MDKVGFGVKILTTKHKGGTILKRVQFKSPETVDFLTKLGITPRKSKTLEIQFPLTWEFLRGVYDGDGTFHHGVTLLTSSVKFKDQLESFYQENGFNPTVRLHKNLYYINLYRKQELTRLFSLLYVNGCTCLERKRDKLVRHIGNGVGNTRLKRGKISISNPVLASEGGL